MQRWTEHLCGCGRGCPSKEASAASRPRNAERLFRVLTKNPREKDSAPSEMLRLPAKVPWLHQEWKRLEAHTPPPNHFQRIQDFKQIAKAPVILAT